LALGYKDAGSGNYEIRATLLGDSDLDGQVNVADLANLAGNFGATSGVFWINGDFDNNGNVNVADLADLAGNFGQSLTGGAGAAGAEAAPASIAAVPEPAALGWLAIGSLGVIGHRRRRRTNFRSTVPLARGAGTPARRWYAIDINHRASDDFGELRR
jgi:hypothetical protein